MTGSPAASVIIVSQGRPDHLELCLLSLRQQDHTAFEVIVVADQPGLDRVAAMGLTGEVKAQLNTIPNISVARNNGLALAAAPVCAFIDDDAVAEPTWLSRLTAPFADESVAAAGGFVRGRNGISLQWGARWIDARGSEHPLQVPQAPSVHRGAPGRAIKTEGTNCAFRRDTICAMGGFDPAYAFYLDETDVNMRLARARAVTAIVPLAQVHHGSAPGPRRGGNRVPRSLFDIGKSTMVFLRRHVDAVDIPQAIDDAVEQQRRRVLRHMVAGNAEPRDVRRLMHSLSLGIAAGRSPDLRPLPPVVAAGVPFLPFPGTGPRPGLLLAGRPWSRRALRHRAEQAVRQGGVVTLLTLSPTVAFHHVRFVSPGIWEQRGGLFGKADRSGPLMRGVTFAKRVEEERARLRIFRPTGPMPTP